MVTFGMQRGAKGMKQFSTEMPYLFQALRKPEHKYVQTQ